MKKKLLSAVLAVGVVAGNLLGLPINVVADGTKVVTLGQDLSQEQRDLIMRYFGVSYDDVQIIYINNDQERAALGAYISSEQIGTHTYSCAYVNPTTSGGLQIKTANLNYVTCNMIATTLSTSGVVNCQVLAAAPFEVSGTGALTGILAAYETATGSSLDPVKKDLATQELVITGDLSQDLGQGAATGVITEAKSIIIQNNITNVTEIQNVLTQVSNEYNVQIPEESVGEIVDLLGEISAQQYDFVQMEANLAKVEANIINTDPEVNVSDEKKQEVVEKSIEATQEAEQVASDLEELSESVETEPATEEYIDGSVEVYETEEYETEYVEGGDETSPETQQGNDGSILAGADSSILGEDVKIDTTVGGEEATSNTEATEEYTETPATNSVDGYPSEESYETDYVDPAEKETEAIETEAAESEGIEETELVTEAITETEEPATDVLETYSMSEEDYQTFLNVKENLDEAFRDGVVMGSDGVDVYLEEESCAEYLKAVESYLAVLYGKGVDLVASEENNDATIEKGIKGSYEYVPVVEYVDPVMNLVDGFVRRCVFDDSEDIFEDGELTVSDMTSIYEATMGVMEDCISSEVADQGVADEEITGEEITE